MKKSPTLLFAIFSMVLFLVSIAAVAVLDRPLGDSQKVTFLSSEGEKLVGTYTRGRLPVGVLLLEGFGSDQVTMKSPAVDFARAGWSVMTFDFSGHGRSPGKLTFDNAASDRLAKQVSNALGEFKLLSGLRSDQIFLVGHSLGARVAIQSATLNPGQLGGLVLMGAQVNLSKNTQSEFFTGTSDEQLGWARNLSSKNPPEPILMISGSWDDVLTIQNASLLAEKLAAGEFNEQRKIVILPALFHNYEPFSPRVLTEIMNWISIQTGEDIERSSLNMNRIAAWFTGYISILLALFFSRKIVEQHQSGVGDLRILIISRRKFFTGKLWLWLASLPVAALLSGLFFMAPLGKPVINLIYVGFIGGNGLLLLFLYWRAKIPGTAGKLPFLSHKEGKNSKAILTALILTALLLIAAALYARTGWFYVFPLNVRIVWLVVFTPITAVGFWIGIHEERMVRQSGGSLPLLSTLGLLPFFLYALLMLAIGSLSGMLGGLQGLLILALVLIFGNLVQEVGKRPWLTAFCQALLLYWLILPQSVLF